MRNKTTTKNRPTLTAYQHRLAGVALGHGYAWRPALGPEETRWATVYAAILRYAVEPLSHPPGLRRGCPICAHELAALDEQT